MSQFIPESLEFHCCFRYSSAAKNRGDLTDDREVRAWPGGGSASGAVKRGDYLGDRVTMGATGSHDPGRCFLSVEDQVAALLSDVGEIPSPLFHPDGEGVTIRFDQDGGDGVASMERAAQHGRDSVEAGTVIATQLNGVCIRAGDQQRRERRQIPPSGESVMQCRGQMRRGAHLQHVAHRSTVDGLADEVVLLMHAALEAHQTARVDTRREVDLRGENRFIE